MDFPLPETANNPRVVLQRCGYHEFVDPNTGEQSFIKRLGDEFYPRFHIYLDQNENMTSVSLHIDQKQASYQGSRAHSGEYSGPAVEAEAERIKDIAINGPKKEDVTSIVTGAKAGGVVPNRAAVDIKKKFGLS